LPCGHWRALTKHELKDLHLMNSSDVVAANADRGRKEAAHVNKPRSTPSATTSNGTPRL
jgi:hypothetical protein